MESASTSAGRLAVATTVAAAPIPDTPPRAMARETDRQVTRSVAWQAAKLAVQMTQYVVLARLVLPAEYGKFALVAPLLALFTALNDGGLSTAAVTNRVYDEQLASDLYWSQLVLGAGLAAVMAVCGPVLTMIYGVPDLQWIAWSLALCLVANAAGLQPRARLRRDVRLGALALIDIAGVLAGLGVALLVARHVNGVPVLVAAQLATVAATAIGAMLLAPVRLQRFRGGASYRHALTVGWHIAGSDVLNAIRNQSPALVIGLFVVLQDVGHFNRANQLVSVPLLVLAPAISNFLLPALARLHADPARFRGHVRRTLQLFLAATIPGSVWIALGPADLFARVIGDEWRPVMPILGALSPLFAVQIMAVVSLVSMVSSERSRTVRNFAIWNLAMTLVVVLATAPFGVLAMAIGLGASSLVLRAPLAVGLAVREGTMRSADVFAAVRFILALAAVTLVALLLVRLLPLAPLVADSVGLGVAAAVSAGVLRHLMRGRPEPLST